MEFKRPLPWAVSHGWWYLTSPIKLKHIFYEKKTADQQKRLSSWSANFLDHLLGLWEMFLIFTWRSNRCAFLALSAQFTTLKFNLPNEQKNWATKLSCPSHHQAPSSIPFILLCSVDVTPPPTPNHSLKLHLHIVSWRLIHNTKQI